MPLPGATPRCSTSTSDRSAATSTHRSAARWDKVFSEICSHIDRASAVQDHVRDHVADYVVTHVVLIDGILLQRREVAEITGNPCTRPAPGEAGTSALRHGNPEWRIKKSVRSQRGTPGGPGEARRPPTLRQGRRFASMSPDRWGLAPVKSLSLFPTVRGSPRELDVVPQLPPPAAIDSTTVAEHYGAVVYAREKRRLARRELSQFPIPMELWT